MLFYFIFIMKSSSTDSGNKKLQKQSFAVVLHNRFFKNFANVIGKHLCCSLFKKGLQDRCFFVNFCEFFCFFVKFLTTIFIQNASGGCFWNFFSYFVFVLILGVKAYSESRQGSEMEFFAKKVNGSHPLTLFAKSSILEMSDRFLNTPPKLSNL